jgi:hypothetical protein
MITFRSSLDLQKLNTNHSAYPIIEELVQRLIIDIVKDGYKYVPEDHGWINLIEPIDVETNRVLTEIWDDWTLLDIKWEGITFRDGYFQGVFLADNEKGFVFLIEDAPWIDGKLRTVIEHNLDP